MLNSRPSKLFHTTDLFCKVCDFKGVDKNHLLSKVCDFQERGLKSFASKETIVKCISKGDSRASACNYVIKNCESHKGLALYITHY